MKLLISSYIIYSCPSTLGVLQGHQTHRMPTPGNVLAVLLAPDAGVFDTERGLVLTEHLDKATRVEVFCLFTSVPFKVYISSLRASRCFEESKHCKRMS